MRRSFPLCLAVLALLATACPRLPEPSGCTPRSYRCLHDRPEVCSATQRWTTIGDLPCGELPGRPVCVVRNDLAFCARPPVDPAPAPSPSSSAAPVRRDTDPVAAFFTGARAARRTVSTSLKAARDWLY